MTSDAVIAPRASSEIELLRAEMREVKFAMSMLPARFSAARTAANLDLNPDTDSEIYDSPYYEAFHELVARGLMPELARQIVARTIKDPILNLSSTDAMRDDINNVVHHSLLNFANAEIAFAADPLAANPSNANAGAIVALVGATGVGKTTTIAKLAARVVLRERRQVELITLDTYRIAGVEQLKTYAEIIGAGCHIARSILELEAMVNRFSANSTVLIDTVGRSPHDLSDQLELADYLRASNHITRCLVLPATMHPVDAMDARRKFALYGIDRLCLTKLDETARPAAALATLNEARLPALYFCAGQRVPEDIELATAETLTARILR